MKDNIIDFEKRNKNNAFDGCVAVGVNNKENAKTTVSVFYTDSMTVAQAIYYLEMAKQILIQDCLPSMRVSTDEDVIDINKLMKEQLNIVKND